MRINSKHTIELTQFINIQDQDGAVTIVAGDDGSEQVVAVGRSGAGREVAWIRPGAGDSVEYQVARRFHTALSAQYGQRITKAVADEFTVELGEGRMDASIIGPALRMADAQHDTFGGVNFFLELHCSAAARTPAFRSACARAGLTAAALAPEHLGQIDALFHRALQQASQGDREPLSPQQGEQLMEQVLGQFAGGDAGRGPDEGAAR